MTPEHATRPIRKIKTCLTCGAIMETTNCLVCGGRVWYYDDPDRGACECDNKPTPPKLVECPVCKCGVRRDWYENEDGEMEHEQFVRCTQCDGHGHTRESLRALIAWREEQGDAP